MSTVTRKDICNPYVNFPGSPNALEKIEDKQDYIDTQIQLYNTIKSSSTASFLGQKQHPSHSGHP